METWAGYVVQSLLQVSLEDASTAARNNVLVTGSTVSLKSRVAFSPGPGLMGDTVAGLRESKWFTK